MRWKNGLEWLTEPLSADLANLIDETDRMVEAGIPQAESVCQQLEALKAQIEWVMSLDKEQAGLQQLHYSRVQEEDE